MKVSGSGATDPALALPTACSTERAPGITVVTSGSCASQATAAVEGARSRAFAENDHRNYNRQGAAFDVGETFSGVDYEQGVAAAQEFAADAKALGLAPSTAAIAWLAQLPEVTTVIPGARSVEQAIGNASAGSVDPLPAAFSDEISARYDRYFRASVHPRW